MRYALACLVLALISAVVAGCVQTANQPAKVNAPGSEQPGVEKPNGSTNVSGAPAKEPAKQPSKNSEKDAPTIDARFEKQLLAVGAEYKDYNKYTQIGSDPHWSHTMCRGPIIPPALSKSIDDPTHGRKLYYLWAKDSEAYYKVKEGKPIVLQPVGQAIVKESYHPVEVTGTVGAHEETIKRDGKTWKMGEKYALFVMLKLDPSTEGTDDGWVYATLSADGTKVTSSGIIKSCAGCHQDCAADRMFGYKPPAPATGRE
ncbi:MAG: cytochrome P460 family protein [Planctomycetes bacterium]|nr:cytochrome P460 family protein [Planctomycetota bacterium]